MSLVGDQAAALNFKIENYIDSNSTKGLLLYYKKKINYYASRFYYKTKAIVR